ncbi:battenin isoform X2 [Nasonia vitripennis]|uniref:Battenin n=1 Tax=Nasonia vitripennis TaxID=7425 RepID=A0A7M7QC74_NASVI|nr:battenin isoform X2 [Nasonia vitripennis]
MGARINGERERRLQLLGSLPRNAMSSSKKKQMEAVATSKNNFRVDLDSEATTGWRNLLAFWILGLCNNYGYVVMLSAAHDILHEHDAEEVVSNNATTNATGVRNCNTLSTGAILLADILPSVAIKLTAPFLPYFVHMRMGSCVVFSAAGFLLVSLSNTRWLAITGVVVTSLSSGLGEVTLLSYSHRYTKNVISTWSSGTGGAGVIGAASYMGLRYFFTAADSLLLMLVVPIVQALTFWLIMTHPEPNIALVVESGGIGSQEQIIEAPKMSVGEKLKLVPGLMKYMIPLGLVYLFEYFINQGLYELIQFDNTFIGHADQYRWLQTDYQIGVFLSRSSVNFISINKIWLMSVLQLANVVLLTFEAVYWYIPNIWIVFALVLWEGLLGGAAYVNTFYRMSKEVPWEQREVSMGIASMADSIGIALAGWASMPVHNAICKLPSPTRLGS